MDIGATYKGKTTLHKITIHGRGGDSVHDEYFRNAADAVYASAAEGETEVPEPVEVDEFSDGTFLIPQTIRLSPPPKVKRKQLRSKLTEAQRIHVI